MIRNLIEGFFVFWVPFVVIIFLVTLISFLFITGKFDKKEPVVDEDELDQFVEEYYADDDRNVWYIRKNYSGNKPYHYTINFYDAETEYIRLLIDGEEIKVEIVELKENEALSFIFISQTFDWPYFWHINPS